MRGICIRLSVLIRCYLARISVATFAAELPQYQAWAAANRPEEWKKLSALKGRAFGELSSQVCKAYLEAAGK